MKTNLLFIWKSKLCLALIMMKACAGFSFRKAGRALLFPSADGQKEAGAAEAEIDVSELNGPHRKFFQRQLSFSRSMQEKMCIIDF